MKSKIIKDYFQSWIDVNISIVEKTFSQDIIYSECYGPEYHGLGQVLQWFKDWNEKGKVLEWSVKRIIEQDNTVVVEWYFQSEYNGEVSGFDGVTIADFNKEMKITKLLEFESKAEHYNPYQD